MSDEAVLNRAKSSDLLSAVLSGESRMGILFIRNVDYVVKPSEMPRPLALGVTIHTKHFTSNYKTKRKMYKCHFSRSHSTQYDHLLAS